MREIVFDTETTGISPTDGHRIVEIGCVELDNLVPTGRTFHRYVNPERAIDAGAVRVHGLTEERLAGEPVFADLADDLMDFLGEDSKLVAHNAPFDMSFLNAELAWADRPRIEDDRVVDTLVLARRQYPGAQNSLDALCKRFGIDLSARALHGALLDAQLLADVYLELCGGRQPDLTLAAANAGQATAAQAQADYSHRAPRIRYATEEERHRHGAFLASLTAPLWQES